MIPVYEVYALRYAMREARRHEHFIGGDPHDAPMPMDYFVWAAVSPERTFILDTGFTARFKCQQGGVFAEDVEVLEAQQCSIERNPDLKLRAYNIDQGGVKARLVIERLRKAQLPPAEAPAA